jgi:hypothetical protein
LAYKLSKLLEIIRDGKWHEAEELQRSMDLTDCEVQEITEFLGMYDFAEVDEDGKRLRVNKDFKKILCQTA